jgi:hypothetical protein
MARKPAARLRLAPHLPVTQVGWIGVKAALTLALLFGLVGGLVWLGGKAGPAVATRDRYTVAVADLRCDAPPGTDRATFLGEVRYLGRLPETVQSVDPTLSATLSGAFAKHPWVAAVTGVTANPDGSVSVGLTFRRPVVLVRVRGSAPRLVDAGGVLLPVAPSPAGVAVLAGEWIPPAVPAGTVWPDPTVTRAAELAAAYQPATIQRLPAGGWRLVLADGKSLSVSW